MWLGVICIGSLAALLAEIPPAPQQDGTFLSLFDSAQHRYTGGGYQDEPFDYRIFVPTSQAGQANSPLIVWLHGHGEGGNDNTAQLRWLDRLVMRAPWSRERFPYFVLAVQCIDGNRNWTTDDPQQDNMVDVVASIIDEILDKYPIDRERIYLAGVSSGGTGCWEMAVRHPQYFAAVAPFASAGTNHPQLGRLIGIPIWTFHSSDDTKPPVTVVQGKVTKLQKLGGTVVLTEIVTGDHDCWTAAFARYDVLDWLFLQRRGRETWWDSPKIFAWRAQTSHFLSERKWWQIALAIAGALAAIVAGARAAKSYRRSSN